MMKNLSEENEVKKELQGYLDEVPMYASGVISSGFCDSPESQKDFDENEVGKPPVIMTTDLAD
jgi:hypothetical protein